MAITLLKRKTHINFTGVRRYAYALSLAVIAAGVAAVLLHGGLRYGVDFAGGVVVQLRFAEAVPDEEVKDALEAFDMPGLTVQQAGADGRDYLLRFSSDGEEMPENLRADIVSMLASGLPDNPATIERLEMVGPKVGSDLRNMAVEALYYSILLITVYISGRFEYNWLLAGALALLLGGIVMGAGALGVSRLWGVAAAMSVTVIMTWKLKLNFALGAIVSLLHDVFTTLAVLAVLGIDIDLNIIAALLTLVGYSLNDTIIVFDRIRENLRALPGKADPDGLPSMPDIINLSLNQTLSRTLLTGGTTLLACLSLFFLGGSVIHDFALTILIGVLLGTYSSIFVASPILMALGETRLYRDKSQVNRTAYERPGEHGVV
jgi:preprotein translocase subunit SecF